MQQDCRICDLLFGTCLFSASLSNHVVTSCANPIRANVCTFQDSCFRFPDCVEMYKIQEGIELELPDQCKIGF